MEITDERLDYIKVVAEHFLPDSTAAAKRLGLSSLAPYVFCQRYVSGQIDESTKEERFIGNPILQKILAVRKLDAEKVWLLCLWAKDYALTTTTYQPGASLNMLRLCKELSALNNEGQQGSINISSKGIIIFSITDKESQMAICDALLEYSQKQYGNYQIAAPSETIDQYRCFYFDNLVEHFLKSRKPNGIKVRDLSIIDTYKDSRYLAGMLIYASGLSDDTKFLDFYKDNQSLDGTDDLPAKKQYLTGKLKGVAEKVRKNYFHNILYGTLSEKK